MYVEIFFKNAWHYQSCSFSFRGPGSMSVCVWYFPHFVTVFIFGFAVIRRGKLLCSAEENYLIFPLKLRTTHVFYCLHCIFLHSLNSPAICRNLLLSVCGGAWFYDMDWCHLEYCLQYKVKPHSGCFCFHFLFYYITSSWFKVSVSINNTQNTFLIHMSASWVEFNCYRCLDNFCLFDAISI